MQQRKQNSTGLFSGLCLARNEGMGKIAPHRGMNIVSKGFGFRETSIFGISDA